MYTAALALIQPAWSIIKPFWKYIVGAVVLIALIWSIHNWYEGKLDAAYNRGVAVTEAKDAAALLAREKINAAIISDLKVSVAKLGAELEGKTRENKLIADDLRSYLRAYRVCSDERSGRSILGNPGPSSESNGARGDGGPAKPVEENIATTVGDDLVTIGEACQSNTDKLTTLQEYVREVQRKLKWAKEKHTSSGTP